MRLRIMGLPNSQFVLVIDKMTLEDEASWPFDDREEFAKNIGAKGHIYSSEEIELVEW